MNEDKFIPRLKWSELEHYHPLRIIITDWKNLKTFWYNRYMVVPSALEYKGKKIELCVPYQPFIRLLRKLPLKEQKMIVAGNAVIEIMKTYKRDRWGMVIQKVESIVSKT